ncbi:hypothetical protein L209DRAFT_135125 [Thermothelomyces heterothallicus CBS 203.75]
MCAGAVRRSHGSRGRSFRAACRLQRCLCTVFSVTRLCARLRLPLRLSLRLPLRLRMRYTICDMRYAICDMRYAYACACACACARASVRAVSVSVSAALRGVVEQPRTQARRSHVTMG